MRKSGQIERVCSLFCFAVVFFALFAGKIVHFNATNAIASAMERVIILDPGHGGVDGGATSAKGLIEKDVNLSIALKLRELLSLSGYLVVMTRETDCSIHDSSANTIREMKSSDIHNRFRLMQQYPGAVFVSVHQNHFGESQYNGAQFFYTPENTESKRLAFCLKNAMQMYLQPQNKREIKPCGKEVYLIHHAENTAVLAECGFLSNPTEASLLATTEYQQKIAFTLYCGILQYYEENELIL